METVELNSELNNFYFNKRIFLTGHTGFKGAWLLAWLHSLKAEVKGYSLAPENEMSLFSSIENKIEFENIFGDIRDKEKLDKEILNFQPDIIFHLAAQALVRKSYDSPAETFDVNVVGTANLLESVKKLHKKCTIIIITTDKVYENKEIDYYYKETDVLGGYDPYSASKAATEIVVGSFRNSFFNRAEYLKHNKAIVSARAGNVIGGGDWNEHRIIPDIIKALQENVPIEVRNPNSIRPWQHVLEPLFGYLKLAMIAYNNYEIVANAYNFGPLPKDHLTVSELVELAIKNWGTGTWKNMYNNENPHEAGILKLDISKAINELNWQPKLDSETSIKWTIDWYQQSSNSKLEFTMHQINQYQQK